MAEATGLWWMAEATVVEDGSNNDGGRWLRRRSLSVANATMALG